MNTEELTPCNGKCFIDPDILLCVGCNRTSDEITNWGNYSEEQKKLIMKELGSRKPGNL